MSSAHCRCGHYAPLHPDDACHRCDCGGLELCRCAEVKPPYCNRCGIPHGGACKRV